MMRFKIEIQGSNSALEYSLNPEDKVDQTAIGMINNNKILNIVPITFHQLDSERYLRYNINSTITLQNFLRNIVGRDKALKIFLSICDLFLVSDEYLLDVRQFILNPQYMYVDAATGECRLVYLAVEGQESELELPVFFKRLVTNIKSDQNEDCTYIATILMYLNSNDHFSLKEFRDLIINAKNQYVPARKENSYPVDEIPKKRLPADEGRITRKVTPIPQTRRKKEVQARQQESNCSIPERKELPIKKEPEEQLQANKVSASEPTGKRQIDNGLGFAIPGQKIEQRKASVQVDSASQNSRDEMSMFWLLQHFSRENLAKYKEQKKEKNQNVPQKDHKEKKLNKGKKRESKNTVLVLSSLDETNPYVWIIDKDQFAIGRRKNNDGVIADVYSNVGREHCMVIRENGSYYVVDKNSKFGTIVDGFTCPGMARSNELHDGSTIELPGIRFRADFKER